MDESWMRVIILVNVFIFNLDGVDIMSTIKKQSIKKKIKKNPVIMYFIVTNHASTIHMLHAFYICSYKITN